jgi:HEAT repeat protein
MASSFAKSLLASVVALVVAGGAVAQDRFQEGVKFLRLGENEEALEAFRDVLKGDPSNAEAMELYRSISQDEWYMLLTQKGEIGKIAQSIMERAKLEKQERSRDESQIAELAATATARGSSYDDRREAVLRLMADHGEFAVPALADYLGDPDNADGQIHAIAALTQMGNSVVLPLVELLKSSNDTMRTNAAAALTHIGDRRAAGAMARLAEQDESEAVRNIAKHFMSRAGIKGRATDLLLAQARGYLTGGIDAGDYSEVVWTLEGDKLSYVDVPELVYALELSKACANDAVMADPASNEARSVLAQANLAEAQVIEMSIAQGSDEAQALEASVSEFKMAALATGPAVLRSALDEGLRQALPAVSVGAIRALSGTEDGPGVATSALVKALDSTDKRVRYEAAVALVEASNGANVPARGKVVAALGNAVTEESLRTIQLIGATPEFQAAAKTASGERGKIVEASGNAVSGLRSLLDMPVVDVVVINEILPDGLPEDIIGNIRNDSRMANAKVIIVAAKDVDAAAERFDGKADAVIAGPLNGDLLSEAVNSALEGVPAEPRNTRAEQFAQSASGALARMAAAKSNISGALGQLAAQLDRADTVAVPAAHALGLGGNAEHLDALMGALNGAGSDELKVAAANALGMILARSGDCPMPIAEGLVAIVRSDAATTVRSAAAGALGKAKCDEAMKARLLNSMRRIGAGS